MTILMLLAAFGVIGVLCFFIGRDIGGDALFEAEVKIDALESQLRWEQREFLDLSDEFDELRTSFKHLVRTLKEES